MYLGHRITVILDLFEWATAQGFRIRYKFPAQTRTELFTHIITIVPVSGRYSSGKGTENKDTRRRDEQASNPNKYGIHRPYVEQLQENV